MKNIPRILPLVGIAIGGVLAVNALAGATSLPQLMSGARAFAEEATKGPKSDKPGKDAKEGDAVAATGAATNASALMSAVGPKPQPVCAPTAAELAKEAGLSPAELQVLQSLGERRGQLDQREDELSTQLALLAAAEAKLDAKVKALTGLKGDIQTLLTEADGKDASEIDRLVKVFEGMKAKDAAPRLTLLDDAVRLPIAAKMKERSLSAIVAQMPPAEAKKLTEGLAKRFTSAQALAASAKAAADQAAAQTGAPKTAEAKPKAPAKQAARKPAPRKAAPAAAQAKAAPTPAPAAAAPAATPPAKAG